MNHQLTASKASDSNKIESALAKLEEGVKHCQQKQKAEHDASARHTTFSQGEVVYARNFSTRWLTGVFPEISGPVSYLVS